MGDECQHDDRALTLIEGRGKDISEYRYLCRQCGQILRLTETHKNHNEYK